MTKVKEKPADEVKECRDALFGEEVVQAERIIKHNGKSFHVKEPKVGERASIMERAGLKQSDLTNIDISRLSMANVYAAFYCTFAPNGKRVFEKSDLEVILDLPSTSRAAELINRLGGAAIAMMTKNTEARSENFDDTPTEKSSSSSPEISVELSKS